ncbi:VaFE repeat-containing surface-anchored protein [Listeria goaensis]|uniref:VaFE repeat-containing surface-anchored protein n=1 Tax=Listeria goaensis TaxID=1649188 RepID=UPI000B588D41|nr:VaFE repeat-containing surface-anchored protein [Listeria goaensis]
MNKSHNKWLTLVLVAFVFVSTILSPVQRVFAQGLDPSQIFSTDGAKKTNEEETALKKGITNKLRSTKVGASSKVVYKGSVSYGGSTVGYFEVDGQQAFCMEHPKSTPPSGTANDGGGIYSNPKIASALYNGVTGSGNIFGSDWSRGTVVTSLVLSELYLGTYQGGKNIPGYDELKAKALAEDYPRPNASLSKTTVNTTISGTNQKTETIKLNGETANKFSFTLPNQISFVNVTTGAKQTGGKVTIKGGDSFYLTAPLTYGTDYSSGAMTGSLKEYSPILYKMTNSAYQTLGKGIWRDPSFTLAFKANFEAQTGSMKVIKKGNDGKLLAGVEFEIKDTNGKSIAKGTSNANGEWSQSNLTFGNYVLVETNTIPGYHLNNKTYPFTIGASTQNITINVVNEALVPKIHTTATDQEDGDKSLEPLKQVSIQDDVAYSGLTTGKQYTVTGTLMDKETGKPVMVDGKAVKARKIFTPTTEAGTAKVVFTFDASVLAGKEVVVFESLSLDGKEVTTHADIQDEGQTVAFTKPKIQTTATDKADNDKVVAPEKKVTVTDMVKYTDLTPGKEYTVTGILMNKQTSKELLINGKPVTATKTFTAKTANGTVSLDFTFDASALKGQEVVVFENVTRDNQEVAVHADLKDVGQTVRVASPTIGTMATDKADGDKTLAYDQNVTLVDEVKYQDLTPNQTYDIQGTIMDKATGKPLMIEGKTVVAKGSFTAKEANGSAKVEFTFNTKNLAGKDLVVFEELYKNKELVADHKDLNDKGQTVKVAKPNIVTKIMPKTGDDNMALYVEFGAILVALASLVLVRRKTKQN